ncbi:MAG: DNA-binding protein [Anaerolineae bacterium]|nr:DNA-binding protein [Anaerolineae bacterium]
MEHATMSLSRIHILRVDPGEDTLHSIQAFLREAHIRQAVVLGGYGTLAAYHLHWVTHNRIPTDNAFGRGYGGIEILAMNGLVVDGEPHIHVALSTPDGAFGGHLEPGCIAYVLCEVFLAEVEGVSLCRERVPVAVEGMGEGLISRLVFGQDAA